MTGDGQGLSEKIGVIAKTGNEDDAEVPLSNAVPQWNRISNDFNILGVTLSVAEDTGQRRKWQNGRGSSCVCLCLFESYGVEGWEEKGKSQTRQQSRRNDRHIHST
jgi:hypothetical protein